MPTSTEKKRPIPAYLNDQQLLQEYEAVASNESFTFMQRAIARHRVVDLAAKIKAADDV